MRREGVCFLQSLTQYLLLFLEVCLEEDGLVNSCSLLDEWESCKIKYNINLVVNNLAMHYKKNKNPGSEAY